MFGSGWEKTPCKGQQWIALTSFSEPNFNYIETQILYYTMTKTHTDVPDTFDDTTKFSE